MIFNCINLNARFCKINFRSFRYLLSAHPQKMDNILGRQISLAGGRFRLHDCTFGRNAGESDS